MEMHTDGDGLRPRSALDGRVPSRRLVAVVLTADDVRDPHSDLHRVAAGAVELDVLVARVDRPAVERRPDPAEAPDYPADDLPHGDSPYGDSPYGDLPRGDLPRGDLPRGEAARRPAGHPAPAHRTGSGPGRSTSLGLGPAATVRLHHLGLRWQVQDADEPDLVAAMSELIGFDPDAGVFCVGPVSGPTGTETAVLARVVRRLARVYGLPVLRYHRPGDSGRIAAPAPYRAPAG